MRKDRKTASLDLHMNVVLPYLILTPTTISITVECSRTIDTFRTACNHSERCLENAKSNKVQLIQAKDFVPVRFWKIANMILIEANRQFINDPEVILLSSNKMINFASKYTLGSKGHSLSIFLSLKEHNICYFSILFRNMSRPTKIIDSKNTTGPYKITVVVQKHLLRLQPY